ncbi:LOW QUALITY PROTEIN: hypothetical protein IFM46972_06278 [Aspergillus udagawae]|uniref:Uncharacterized protein n=1 Tax=Aspergillus udagawae TaxID=91492 RepID=A0A8H3NVY7_9EURO|nr:LOW QUALITY PROTEIN: hypothetical protein IFM46972_06278 [Aspergillus udagawae]
MAPLDTQAEAEPEHLQHWSEPASERNATETSFPFSASTSGEMSDGVLNRPQIKVKSDSHILSCTEDGLIYDDGTYPRADLSMPPGLQETSETQHKNTLARSTRRWRVIGALTRRARSRAPMYPLDDEPRSGYTRFVALQVLADLVGNPFPVYSEIPHC